MEIVKLITDDDGYVQDNSYWHWVDSENLQGPAVFCTQEFFGLGESILTFEYDPDGEITCPACIKKLKSYKAQAIKARLR